MNLVALPAFTDNYIWLLHDGTGAIVVDPGDAAPVRDALDALGLELRGILVTHHHADHVGGVRDLLPLLADGARVWGPAGEALPIEVEPLAEGDRFTLMDRVFDVIDVPGHTAGHIAFVLMQPAGETHGDPASAPDAAPILFCGDTLFSAGCGRLFEGTPAQMLDSLRKLAALPGHTRVCCAHEYTLSNLRFARTVEPRNEAAARHEAWCLARRDEQQPTLPSTLAVELQINPFLRCDVADVRDAAMRHDPSVTAEPVSVLAGLRQWKNVFR
ncbi:hydroxyacylglutathione hydrolase [Roseateles chitosanitabidus]|uniref:hydroxyacylglutathione hydrolase n=1 Tax=Roseateles chitosanitabidus TaxID=65048 RepID=UPI00083126B8|nr:hydroxyacylglutathione hydrolase [Roseateles chitosanitabidus]MBO9684972.1 hydroxyacylglutathione hydrolase [Roseateles chitosanitabidus]